MFAIVVAVVGAVLETRELAVIVVDSINVVDVRRQTRGRLRAQFDVNKTGDGFRHLRKELS
jgi:hypothetical protein